MNRTSWLALAACCCALSAAALSTRPDRDDAEYLELASRYTSSVPLGAPGGEGVLISARWVLTAAHRARVLQTTPGQRLKIGSAEHEIASIIVHPGWKTGEPGNDVALIHLKSDVRGIAPTPVYRVADEKDATVVFAAHGADRRKRAAINTVDHVASHTLGLDLKPLAEASDLQGGLSPNETGAPLFIQTPEGLHVAGIAVATDGKRDTYARMSSHARWVDTVLLETAKREADELLGDR